MRNDEIGIRIRSRRSELDIPVADLAERLSMSRATLHRYENGEIRQIKLPVIESIARELRCNPAWLIGKSSRKEAVADVRGDRRYMELLVVLEDVTQHVISNDGITCNGRRMTERERKAVAAGLRAIREMATQL